MIEVKHIYKGFEGRTVLEDISINFSRGLVNLIIGQSGSGKSVLTKCIVGLLKVDAGSIIYDGKNFTAMPTAEKKDLRQEIGMMFQGSALFDFMTVEENIMFPLTIFTKMSKKKMLERVNVCLERVNLKGINNLMPSEASGGMQKRIALARAIVMKPKYLFVDEPNSGLDPQTSIVIDNLISDITREMNITTVVITHDMNSVMEIGDAITFIYKGKKWWEGNKTEILNTNNKELNDFVYASEFMKTLKENLRSEQ